MSQFQDDVGREAEITRLRKQYEEDRKEIERLQRVIGDMTADKIRATRPLVANPLTPKHT